MSDETTQNPKTAPAPSSNATFGNLETGSSLRENQSGSATDNSGDDDQRWSVQFTDDDVQAAITAAFHSRNVPIRTNSLEVAFTDHGIYQLSACLAADGMTPSQDTLTLIRGSVTVLNGVCTVAIRLLDASTSEILQSGTGTAHAATADAMKSAASDALASLTLLHTQ